MKLLVTGGCGFAGATLIERLIGARDPGALDITVLDNLSRPGAYLNREALRNFGVKVVHGDVRSAADFENLDWVDWVIDCAANPSVLAGIDGRTSPRQVVEHNLLGTVNMLEFARRHSAGFILLSTSRVYSIPPLAALKLDVRDQAFAPSPTQDFPPGLSPNGIAESFSTAPPVSLYGATKAASELLALEYGATCGFPVWVNRCGVLAGAGQFGRADQGIFSFWIQSWFEKAPLRYIGFHGAGHQVRDALHPGDLAPLLTAQMNDPKRNVPRILNAAGGRRNATSLARLSEWCAERFGPREVAADPTPRPFDIPWMVLDCARAADAWHWRPETPLSAILAEIASHAESNPHWLDLTA